MLLYENDLPDLRLESEARRLARAGHRLFIICERQNAFEYQIGIETISVVRLKLESPFFRAINRIIYLFFLIDCFWFLALFNLHRHHCFDIFHIHDIPLARTIQILAGLINRRIVLDLHENYPVIMQAFRPLSMSLRMRIKKRIFFSLSRWKRYERSVLRGADQVIAVVDEAKERIADLEVPRDSITVVGNTLKESFRSFRQKDENLEAKFASNFIISYIGSSNLYVRLDTVIKAIPTIITEIPSAHLLVVGEGALIPEYRTLVSNLGIENHVTFMGWQPISRIPSFMSVSDVGLLPFVPNEHHHNTVANKLFQYMYMRCPVISSQCMATARIIMDSGCGLVVNGSSEDPIKLAEVVFYLFRHPEHRREMGRRAREAVLQKYRWTDDGDRLAELYKRIEVS
jgi:glycosyltransferase involved in cell wall biosynthesis